MDDIITSSEDALEAAADVGLVAVPNHNHNDVPPSTLPKHPTGRVWTTVVGHTQRQRQRRRQQPSERMLVNHNETLLIAVRELEHLFVDPPKNPFSPYEVELMGESGLQRIVRLLSSTSAGALSPFYRVGHKHTRIIVLLPPDAIQPDADTIQTQARDALTRFCELKIADNEKELFITMRQAGRLLLFGFFLLLGCMGLSLLFSSDKTPDALWTATLAEGFNIIGWVLLWHPFEAYLYDPIPIRIESRVYTFLNSLVLEVRPQRNTIITPLLLQQIRQKSSPTFLVGRRA
jgi:hypothetical protein